ncbi:MAG: carboxypeptidase regulatory-like domain-containing protein [Methanobacteriota archaeon]
MHELRTRILNTLAAVMVVVAMLVSGLAVANVPQVTTAADGDGTATIWPGTVVAGSTQDIYINYTVPAGDILVNGGINISRPGGWTPLLQSTTPGTAGYIDTSLTTAQATVLTNLTDGITATIIVTTAALVAGDIIHVVFRQMTAPTSSATGVFWSMTSDTDGNGAFGYLGTDPELDIIAGAPTALEIYAIPVATPAGTPSGGFSVRLVDTYDNPTPALVDTPVSLFTTSGTGTFLVNPVTILTGNVVVNFNYNDTTAGTYTITVNKTGLTNDTTSYTVNPAGPDHLVPVGGLTRTIYAGNNTGPIQVTVFDQYDNTVGAGIPVPVYEWENGSLVSDTVNTDAAGVATTAFASSTIPMVYHLTFNDTWAPTANTTFTITTTGPVVEDTSVGTGPATGSIAFDERSIMIQFDRMMDPDSINSSIAFTNWATGDLISDGVAEWTSDFKTVYFNTTSDFMGGTMYNLYIGTGARANNSIGYGYMAAPFSVNFTATIPDDSIPTQVTGVKVVDNHDGSLNVSWQHSDADTQHYYIAYRTAGNANNNYDEDKNWYTASATPTSTTFVSDMESTYISSELPQNYTLINPTYTFVPYQVWVWAEDWSGNAGPVSAPVTVTPYAPTIVGFTYSLSSASDMAANVNLTNTISTTSSWDDGFYAINNIYNTVRQYGMNASHPSYKTNSTALMAAFGAFNAATPYTWLRWKNFTLAGMGGYISGKVTDSANKVIGNATVSAVHNCDTSWYSDQHAGQGARTWWTGNGFGVPAGSFFISNLPYAKKVPYWMLKVTADGYLETTKHDTYTNTSTAVIKLQKSAKVFGNITYADGKGVSMAYVYLYDNIWGQTWQSAWTNATGYYEMGTGLKTSNYTINMGYYDPNSGWNYYWYQPTSSKKVTLTVDQAVKVDFVIPVTKISGRVKFNATQNATGGTVYLYNTSYSNYLPIAATGINWTGGYQLGGFKAGNYQIEIKAQYYEPSTGQVVYSMTKRENLTFTEGEQKAVDYTMSKAGRLMGRITNAEGKTVDECSINVRSQPILKTFIYGDWNWSYEMEESFWGYVNWNGWYNVTGYDFEGTFTVDFDVNSNTLMTSGNIEAYAVQYSHKSQSTNETGVVVAAGEVKTLSKTLPRSANVHGRVMNATTGLYWASVRAYDEDGSQVCSGYTNSTGYYVLDSALPSGTYKLKATLYGYKEANITVTLVVGTNLTAPTITINESTIVAPVSAEYKTKSIAGYVLDWDGDPVNGAVIFYKKAGSNESWQQRYTTGSLGSYNLTFSYKTTYTGEWYETIDIMVSSCMGEPAYKLGVVLGNGTYLTKQNITLTKSGEISGIVTDANGAPIKGAYVYAKSPETPEYGAYSYYWSYWYWWYGGSGRYGNGYGLSVTDSNGYYHIYTGINKTASNLTVGVYIWPYGYGEATNVTLVDGKATGVNIKLTGFTGTIVAHVQDAEGNPIENASVFVYSVNSPRTYIKMNCTDENGTAVIGELAPGIYDADAWKGGYELQTRAGVTVRPSDPSMGQRYYDDYRSESEAPTTTDLYFSLGNDVTPPTVTSVTPEANATEISRDNASIEVTFSEPVKQATAEGAFSLKGTDGVAVAGTFSWDETGMVMTFKPGSRLRNQDVYTVTVGTGTADYADLTMAAAFTSTFTTEWNLTVAPTTSATLSTGVVVTVNAVIDGDGTISVAEVAAPDTDDEMAIGVYVDISLVTTDPNCTLVYAIIVIDLSGYTLPDGFDIADFKMYYWNGAAWVEAENTQVDVAGKKVTANVTHFTVFAVRSSVAPVESGGGGIDPIVIGAVVAVVVVVLLVVVMMMRKKPASEAKPKEKAKKEEGEKKDKPAEEKKAEEPREEKPAEEKKSEEEA